MLFAATDWPTLASLSVKIGDSQGLQVWYLDMDAETGAKPEKNGERLTVSRPLWQSSRCSKRSRLRSHLGEVPQGAERIGVALNAIDQLTFG